MRIAFAFALLAATSVLTIDAVPAAAGQECRMEKQCRWVNFKKVCTMVKVCRDH